MNHPCRSKGNPSLLSMQPCLLSASTIASADIKRLCWLTLRLAPRTVTRIRARTNIRGSFSALSADQVCRKHHSVVAKRRGNSERGEKRQKSRAEFKPAAADISLRLCTPACVFQISFRTVSCLSFYTVQCKSVTQVSAANKSLQFKVSASSN